MAKPKNKPTPVSWTCVDEPAEPVLWSNSLIKQRSPYLQAGRDQ